MLFKPRWIMFDWGGTLVHTHRERAVFPDCARAATEAMGARGVRLDGRAADNLHRRFLDGWGELMASANLEEFDLSTLLRGWAEAESIALPEDVAPLVDAFWRPWVGCLEPLGEVVATLQRLAGRGMALGLVSNCATAPHVCHLEIARQGIASCLAFSLFSSELGVRKPHPRVYAEALARASRATNGRAPGGFQPADVLFVGDTPTADVTGPARAGMRTALVRTGNWQGDATELVHPPDIVVDSVHALPDLWT